MAEAGRLCIQTPFASIRPAATAAGWACCRLFHCSSRPSKKPTAASSDIAFIDDGNITSKDLGTIRHCRVDCSRDGNTPEQHKLIDDPWRNHRHSLFWIFRQRGQRHEFHCANGAIPGRAAGSASHFLGGAAARARSHRQRRRWIEHASAARIHTASAKHQFHYQQYAAAEFHPASWRREQLSRTTCRIRRRCYRLRRLRRRLRRAWWSSSRTTPGIRRPIARPAR